MTLTSLVPRPELLGGDYPRPQLVRDAWVSLDGPWRFRAEVHDAPSSAPVPPAGDLDETITVPFPPEAPLSGVRLSGDENVFWYRRTVTAEEVAAAGHAPGRRLLLHLGAVDYRADVWAGGDHLAHHEGGHTPLTVDVTAAAASGDFDVVVRANDEREDVEQPRGKQDWEASPHVIWYPRTSGIWQPVWLESVPALHLERLRWSSDVPSARVRLDYEIATPPAPGTVVQVAIASEGRVLARAAVEASRRRGIVEIDVPALRNGQDYERFLWSPERPVLLDAVVQLADDDGVGDRVESYLGLRSVRTESGELLLNDRPHFVRGVLSQGYWPQSHLAAPSAAALRAEVELIKELGFTTARIHQKIEDPRFLYWADRLGLMVWCELPSAYEFSATSVSRLVREWIEVVERDASHPSIVAWVPVNESWGVQHIAHSPEQRHLARTLYHLTKATDAERLVISNDGWEHLESDLLTVHDYRNEAAALERDYRDAGAVAATVTGVGPSKRLTVLPGGEASVGAPVILSEFGGVSYLAGREYDGAWGYREVDSAEALEEHLRGLFGAVGPDSALAGWCYTQLTDTFQETNGLVDENRVPKLPVETIRSFTTA